MAEKCKMPGGVGTRYKNTELLDILEFKAVNSAHGVSAGFQSGAKFRESRVRVQSRYLSSWRESQFLTAPSRERVRVQRVSSPVL
ncbi:hypothetical protein MHYP_G00338680 [Metynnis hypsauchen]